MGKFTAIILSLCLVCTALNAQTNQLAAKKSLQALRIQERVTVDAALNEPFWANAAVADQFLFRWPTPGNKATQKTEVKVAYNDYALYIGVRCFDSSPDSIYHRITKRDELENSDDFFVTIDTYRDGQNAVQFGVSPDNVQFDSKFSIANADPNNDNADGEDPSWDAVWNSAAQITADGWVAELEIPYSALRFPVKPEQEWSINFGRSIKRHGESDCWNEVKANMSGSLSQMGILTNIKNIKAPLRLSATPFVAAYADNIYHQDQAGWRFPYSAGMDVKIGLNEAFTLDATIIPDFGQVRSDQNVLNLSPFEVKFAENRPFFTEGTELFNKGYLFYSRRVGGLPLGYRDVADNLKDHEELVENPVRAQLLNATKVSGRTDKGLGIGVFNAVEQSTYATIRNTETGVTHQVETAPLTDKSVFVLDQNLKHNSSVTFINTNVTRAGAAIDANVTGLVFNLKNKAQSYALSGKTVMSNRVSPDKRETGYTGVLDFSKTSGNFLFGAFGVIETDHYNPNDLGYLFSPNEKSGNVYINYNRYKPWWKLNNFWSGLWAYGSHLYRPDKWTETQIGGNFGFNTRTFHNCGVYWQFSPKGRDDYFEPRTGNFSRFYHVPSDANAGFWYNSDHRKRITFHANGGVRKYNEHGRANGRLYLGARWRASDKLTFGLNVGNELSFNNVGWVSAKENALGYEQVPANAILFGRRNLVGFDNQIDCSYSFNTRMNLSLYVRHYWQRVEYQSFAHLRDNGELEQSPYTGYSAEHVPLNDIAANYFNIDLVYTWRFAPGSDILLVYKNGIGHEAGGMEAREGYVYNVQHLPDFEGTNSLSMKILYYLDYNKMKKWF
ncbi:MAG: DUF5916 domain-containing protein [Bacteroidota bacterium]